MAHKRMFSKDITESDAFADMPLSTQALYFHLGMSADDDGFVNNAKKIQRGIGASPDDLNLLIAKKFLIKFDSGVVVIKHWRINNAIRNDRKNDTKYSDEMGLLCVQENGSYSLADQCSNLLPMVTGDSGNDEETLRQKAYRESSLPYSFDYKIRRAFEGQPCPICGAAMSATVEDGIATDFRKPSIQHNLPLSKGGKHELGNISVICHQCNVSIRDEETGKLNSEQVIDVWNDICRANDGQMTGNCQSDDRIDIGEDRIEEERKGITSGKPDHTAEIAEVVDYLNARLGTSYRSKSKETASKVNARLEEGFTVSDFKAVIDSKVSQWGNDPKMQEYLRPKTLFAPSNFEAYLQATKQKAVIANAYAEYD